MPIAKTGLAADFRLMSDWKYDPYGSAVGMHFTIAFELYHRGCEIPGKWEFRPPMGSGDIREHEDAFFDSCEGATEADLVSFGNVLSRYASILRAQGRSY